MEMNVDRHLIRSERERRAWSHEHLAAVADLGLRTIQRIEATGLAIRSARASAALKCPSPSSFERTKIAWLRTLRLRVTKATAALAASLVVVASLFFGQKALAKDVMLNVGLTLNNEERIARLLTADGKDAEIRVPDLFRLVIIPTVRPDGSVHLSVQIYESVGSEFVLLSEPKLATAWWEAEIRCQ
jgi:hypothetical protein